jgi:hypothetical protein
VLRINTTANKYKEEKVGAPAHEAKKRLSMNLTKRAYEEQIVVEEKGENRKSPIALAAGENECS